MNKYLLYQAVMSMTEKIKAGEEVRDVMCGWVAILYEGVKVVVFNKMSLS